MAQVYKTDLLEDALREMCSKLEGVQGAVIVSIEGFVVASYSPRDSDMDEGGPTSSPQVAAMAATLIALGERTLSRLAQGDMLRLLIEGSDGGMLVVPANQRASVAVMVDREAKMGLVLYALQQSSRKISAILEGGSN
ncbi:MAG: roadblock/LC7 domain-containing protein [Anaerolineae bacterium]|nr:roadblock/LC7 domain-containing protein [Anaerolineae bacterium]MCB0177801.1 roadblock/LC7 domain-containing protein [Anaerolineae bacterium]MCB0224523.1 roadblock/LC7 domain-containing protein [Anaerolineae bacterium]